MNRLSASDVKAAPLGKHADGGGLWLVKREDGGAQWVLRATAHGRRREAARNIHKLGDIALDAFESRKADLKGDGKAGRWFSPLELHVLPKLGKVPVSDIDQKNIRDTLAPIWHTKADTARKAMNRLGIVLRHAAALGLEVYLQATKKAKALLGKQRHTVTNTARDELVRCARILSIAGGSITELALRLLILTAVRSYPLRFMHVNQIDGDVWSIPAAAMKGRLGGHKWFSGAVLFRIPSRHR